MKFFAVFAAVLALAAGSPYVWTLQELSDAIQNPSTNPEYLPYLEGALNQMMADLHAGKPVTPSAVIVPTSSDWTLQQLSAALENPNTDPALTPYLVDALNAMMSALHNGNQIESIPVIIPVGLEPVHAVNPAVPVPTPVIAVPVVPTPVVPAPVLPAPVLPSPEVPAPELPAPELPAAPATPASSPLVQIVVNINQQQQVTPGPALIPSKPEIAPTPVTVVEEAENISVNPVDVIAIQPMIKA